MRRLIIGSLLCGWASGATAEVPALSGLALANDRRCGVNDTGTAWCWSDGPATPIEGLDDATALAAGLAHLCALRRDGSVRCWGGNERGQAGIGTHEGVVPTPTAIQGLEVATDVAAGDYHSCAIGIDGSVWCWGDNRFGQLGALGANQHPVPVLVPAVDRAVLLTAGYAHTCAVTSYGTVLCWGYNRHGQSGSDTRKFPGAVAAHRVDGPWQRVKAIDAGGQYTCAIADTGWVWCWGAAGGDSIGTQIPAPMYTTGDAVEVSVGDGHACVLTTEGIVNCWGANDQGQLGEKEGKSYGWGAWGLTDATNVAAGYGETCAVRAEGSVSCWGRVEPTIATTEAVTSSVHAKNPIPAAKEAPRWALLQLDAEEVLDPSGARLRFHLQTVDTVGCDGLKLPAKMVEQGSVYEVTLGEPDTEGCEPGVGPGYATVDVPLRRSQKFDLVVQYAGKVSRHWIQVSGGRVTVLDVDHGPTWYAGDDVMFRTPEGAIALSCSYDLDHPMCAERASQGLATCDQVMASAEVAALSKLPKRAYAHQWFRDQEGAYKATEGAEALKTAIEGTYGDGSGCLQIEARTWLGEVWTNR